MKLVPGKNLNMVVANRLTKLPESVSDDIAVIIKLDSVASDMLYFQPAGQPDLIFMDIPLADVLSFDNF